MPTQQHCEETYPLLLLFLDDETARGRRIQIEKGRYHGITSGASAVITQWPNNLAPCWMVSLLCGLFVLLVTLLALSAASSNVHYGPSTTQCIGSHLYDYKKINNETVHLVHGSDAWHKNQIATLEDILQNYDACKVHLVLVGYNKSSEVLLEDEVSVFVDPTKPLKKRSRKKREKKEKVKETVQLVKEPRRKKRSVTKIPHGQTLRDVLVAHPDIILETLNFTEAFNNSPLYNKWQNLNEITRIFAIRTIYLWQYGGISFDLLEENYKDLSRYKYNSDAKTDDHSNNTNTAEDIVVLGLNAFKQLPNGVVTIDDKGWHMESKTSCHAFFGDMLMNLRKADSRATPEQVIKRTLNVFCRRGSTDSSYCSTVKR